VSEPSQILDLSTRWR